MDENGSLYLNCSLINAYSKAIKAVKISCKGFNSFNEKILIDQKEDFTFTIQDIFLRAGYKCDLKNVVKLPNSEIRKVDLEIIQILCEDGTIENIPNPIWVKGYQKKLPEKYAEMAKSENRNANYYSIAMEDYWQCTCGYVNNRKCERCFSCNMDKVSSMGYTEDYIEISYKLFCDKKEKDLKIEEQKEEEKKIALEKLKKKKKIITIILGIILSIALVISGINFYTNWQEDKTKQAQEQEFLDSIKGEFVFIFLLDHKDDIILTIEGTDIDMNDSSGTIIRTDGDSFYVEWTAGSEKKGVEEFKRIQGDNGYDVSYNGIYLRKNK